MTETVPAGSSEATGESVPAGRSEATGESVPAGRSEATGESVPAEFMADLEEAMRDVVDPELGINVVDLGLVYGLSVEKAAVKDGEQKAGTVAVIDMTLTSPACPLTDVIEDQTLNALVGTGLVNEVKINWVWNPPWGPDKITDDGREQLRALGFTV